MFDRNAMNVVPSVLLFMKGDPLAEVAYKIFCQDFANRKEIIDFFGNNFEVKDSLGQVHRVRVLLSNKVPVHQGKTLVVGGGAPKGHSSKQFRPVDYCVRFNQDQILRNKYDQYKNFAVDSLEVSARVKRALNQMFADYFVRAIERVQAGLDPWGTKPGTKQIPYINDPESVLCAFGTRIDGPKLKPKTPLRLHIPLCPNRTECMQAIATTLSARKVRRLQDLVRSIAHYVDDLEVYFYVFNGETVKDENYLHVNYPGIWSKARVSEWCDKAYEVTQAQLIEPLRSSTKVHLSPTHEVLGDLNLYQGPSDEVIQLAHDAYPKFATSEWGCEAMATVTACDFKLTSALFNQLGYRDVVLTSKFHIPIWKNAYLKPLRQLYPDVGVVAVSRDTLFGMSFD